LTDLLFVCKHRSMPDTTDLQPTSSSGPFTASLPGRAVDDLRFIRRTMERAAAFSAVPGWGGVLMGLVAFVAAPVASRAGSQAEWTATWLVAAVLAASIGAVDIVRKVRFHRASLLRGPGWRFAMSLAPSFAAAACLTGTLAAAGLHERLPGLWLLLYGSAAFAAGPYSIRQVRVMGAIFMLIGVLALATPAAWANVWMVAGFGGLHVLFGAWIARCNDPCSEGGTQDG
jgi:hypothetical protein